ncbi:MULTISPECIES: haloacid dehalogenase [Anaerolinea]|uniref:haloacid dehalogenase n=1 Tax=Anaerolinea TaxID=233189 RepID=UPI00262FA72C|nr:haloacid dehalogenase [Anaerolinea thermophila]
MNTLPEIAERIHQALEARTRARDQALNQTRALTRHAAHAIRAAHREEWDIAGEQLDQARHLVRQLQQDLAPYPELYYAGYTQDAIKEFAEASITCAIIQNHPLPSPEELGVEEVTYLNGLAESAGELRRRCLDILRQGYSQEAERLLSCMDDIYDVLVTMDYPDAVTNGLRRQTDVTRSLLERTRGDITLSQREQHLEQVIREAIQRLEVSPHDSQDDSRL